MDDKVFVYGTLKKGLGNHRIISRHVRSVRNASMRGWMFNLGYYPAVVSGCGIVHGQVLELENAEKAFRAMDILEGYIEPEHTRNLYDRVKTTVLLDSDGGEIGTEEVYVYLYPERNKEELSAGSGFMPEGVWFGESGQVSAERMSLFFASESSMLPSSFDEILSNSAQIGRAEWEGAQGTIYLIAESEEFPEYRKIDMEISIDGLHLPCFTYLRM